MGVVTFFEGQWGEDAWLMKATTNASWLGNVVFDGARAFGGTTPDIEYHCERVVNSARGLGMIPPIDAGELVALVREGVKRFEPGAELYIRPMMWVETGIAVLDYHSTKFALVLQEVPMPDRSVGFSAGMARWRKPSPEAAPTHIKASCLYPIPIMAAAEAREQGFENAVMLDPMGNVAEFTLQNLFMVRDGELHTPATNGSFLDGITRRRVISLLRENGFTVQERIIKPHELLTADEMFSTGNYAKVQALTRYLDRDFEFGPVTRKAQELYWDFALSHRPLPLREPNAPIVHRESLPMVEAQAHALT